MIIPIQQITDLKNIRDMEILLTNGLGGYMSSTVALFNRRKYHALMVCSLENENNDNISMVSSIDETLITESGNYELASHLYPGVVHPEGFRYIEEINTSIPYIIYKAGDVRIKKEIVFVENANRLLVKYSVLECKDSFTLRLMPLFSFRSIHSISHANDIANKDGVVKGESIIVQPYQGLPALHIQSNSKFLFYPKGQWYYNIKYAIEKQRGYESEEDLFSSGNFEIWLKQNDEFIISFSTQEEKALEIPKIYAKELKRQDTSRDTTLTDKLNRTAKQFIIKQQNETKIVAGFPWFGSWGRDAFISIEGLTIEEKGEDIAVKIVDSMIKEMSNGLFINMGQAYNSVDAPLWFFHSLQWIAKRKGDEFIYKRYFNVMKSILEAYRYGKNEGISMKECALIYADIPGKALTWMDAIISSGPVTPRSGYQVDINALWYNAICYTLSLAKEFNEPAMLKEWKGIVDEVKSNFISIFWSDERGFLADYADHNTSYFDIRPNQIIATSLDYTILNTAQKTSIMNLVKSELLTKCGLRTLSRNDYRYSPYYGGDQERRDKAYHNGTVWVWQLEHYIKCGFDIFGTDFIEEAKDIYNGFDEFTYIYGIGSIAEVYDAEEPHSADGSISQAWSVGALLRINQMINEHEKELLSDKKAKKLCAK